MRKRIKNFVKDWIKKTKFSYSKTTFKVKQNKNKDKCPLKGNCLIKNVVYKVKVESKGPDKIYIGFTAGSFKDRYANHKHTF